MKRITAIILLIPTTVGAQAPLPHACTQAHAAYKGEPAPCSGVLSPAVDAIEGATCLDADLPTCQALRKRDADTYARRAVMLSEAVSASDAMVARWKALALAPAPVAPPVTVVRETGAPAWLVGIVAAGAALLGGWVVWQVR